MSIILIASNHLRILIKDRTAVLMMLVVPLVLSFVTGMALGGLATGPTTYVVPVAFVDADGGPQASDIIRALSAPPYRALLVTEEEARNMVANREVSVAVFIPQGVERSLRRGDPVEILILRSAFREGPRMVQQQLGGLLVEIQSAAAAANLAHAAGGDWSETYAAAVGMWDPRPPVTVTVEQVVHEADTDIPMGYDLASPGYVVMFGMFMTITAGAGTLLSERDGGTLGRLAAAPVTAAHIMAGKALGIMCGAMVQMSVLIGLGRLFFGVNWGANVPALAMLVVSLTVATTGMGIFLASVCRTSSQAGAVGVLAVLVMSMLGGTWWPLEVMPSHMQLLAKLVPSGWAMEGFTGIIIRGAGPGDVLPGTLVLVTFGIVFLSLGIRLFRPTE